ncbi:MAG: DsbA family protein [Hyphomicrobiaceae bacterium]
MGSNNETWLTAFTRPTTPMIATVAVALVVGLAFFATGRRDTPVEVAQATNSATSTPPSTQPEQAAAPPVAVAEAGAEQPAAATAETTAAAEATKPAFDETQTAAIEAIVRTYLLEKNPELLIEISQELERRQMEKQGAEQRGLILSKADALYRTPTDYVFGNRDGDVSVIEFFDYNCSWCRRAVEQVQALAEGDPNVRIVMKEFPIFGEHSTFAAKAAMASMEQGKYWPFHVALMSQERVTTDNVLKIAESVGIDVERLKKEMENPKYDAAIAETQSLAETLGIQGTPAFIVDTTVNMGFVPAAGLKAMVSSVREAGCQAC